MGMDWLSQDLDLFNGVDETPEVSEEMEETPVAEPMEEMEDEQDNPETNALVDQILWESSEPSDSATAPEMTEPAEPETTEEDVDVDALVREILWQAAEVDDKVEDIKDEAASTGNEELLGMIDELQTLLAEKNQTIEELTRKNDITSNRLMDKYWDAENYSFYKWTIDKLENNPQLNMLVKYFDSDNESMKNRVVAILSDMISEKTWVDINDAINNSQKKSVWNALTDVQWWREVWTPEQPEEEPVYDREQSLNNLF